MPTGRTADAGWQIGVSRTLRASPDEVWSLIASPRGVAIWLGAGVSLPTEVGHPWRGRDGSHGEVRSYRPGDRIRVTCLPAGWDHETTVQVATAPATEGRTVLRFHQERMSDSNERDRQRVHWQAVMDRVDVALSEPS